MRITRPVRTLAATGVLLVVAACGGGGGGAPATPPSPPDSGVPVFSLTAANAPFAARTVFRIIEEASFSAEMASFAADFADVSGSGVSTCVGLDFIGVPMRIVLTDVDGDGSVSAGDVVAISTASCKPYRLLTSTFSLSSVERTEHRISGVVEFEAVHDSGAIVQGKYAFESSFRILTRADYHQVLTELDATLAEDGFVESMTAGRFERDFDFRATFTYHFSGSVSSERVGGSYSFGTTVAFVGSGGEIPSDGMLVLATPASRARVATSSTPEVSPELADVQVDPDASGQFGPIEHVRWLDISAHALSGWQSNARPEISDLRLSPEHPTAADDIVASVTVTDPDGDTTFEAYEWRINGEIVASARSHTLAAGPFVKGDTIELTVTTSDGELEASSSAIVLIANQPPSDVTVSLTPLAPRTGETLLLSWEAVDADADDLEAAIQWQRNGTTIAGETGMSLAPAQTAKNDVITALVWVSDGEDTVAADASVTIIDSPANVTFSNVPASVQHGESVSFTAIATDPDGDSVAELDLLVDYGPAGMAVNADTGLVSWTPLIPLFDQSLTVNFSVTVDEAGAGAATGSIVVEDPDRRNVLMRGAGGWGRPVREGLVAGDFDGDSDSQVLVAGTTAYEIESAPGGYRQSWMNPFAFSGYPGLNSITTGDIDGDGRQEIFLANDEHLILLDGLTRTERGRFSQSLEPDYYCVDLEFADINVDGRFEVVCLATRTGFTGSPFTPGMIVVLDAATLDLLAQLPVETHGASLELGNVDLDPALEIVTEGGFVIDGSTLATEWQFGTIFGFAIAVGDVNSDGRDDIVAGNDNLGELRAYDAVSESLLWSIPRADHGSILIADVTNDGKAEIIVGDGRSDADDRLSIYHDDGGTVTLIAEIDATTTGGIADIVAADIDADGDTEIIWASQSSPAVIAIASSDLSIVEWSSAEQDPPRVLGEYVGGELARDGINMPTPLFLAVTQGFGDLRLISLNPETEDVIYSSSVTSSHAGRYAMTVADYDDDGNDEALVTPNQLTTPAAVAFDFARNSTEWESLQPGSGQGAVAVAHGDLTGDGRDDLAYVAANGELRAYDVFFGELIWIGPTLQIARDIAIADLDSSGTNEIIVGAEDRVHIFCDQSGDFVALAQSLPLPGLRDIEVADLDADGLWEVLVLYTAPLLRTAIETLNGDLESTGHVEIDWNAPAFRVSPSQPRNLLVATATHGPQLVAVDAGSGAEIWRSPRLMGTISAPNTIHFVDWNNDGIDEIALGTAIGMFVTR